MDFLIQWAVAMGCFVVGVALGLWSSHTPADLRDFELESERRKRYQAEIEKLGAEERYSRDIFNQITTFHKRIEDMYHSCRCDSSLRFQTVKETEAMHAALSKAMVPLEKLKDSLK